MKQFTTMICCVCLMIAGISLAIWDNPVGKHQQLVAAPVPQWGANSLVPLDLKLNLDKRQLNESPTIKDSVHIRDSIRITEKVKWKIRYKNVAARTVARNEGMHLAAVTPDSMPNAPLLNNSTLGREEQPKEIADTSKVSSIQLTVDGKVVYSKNDNHSGVEGQ